MKNKLLILSLGLLSSCGGWDGAPTSSSTVSDANSVYQSLQRAAPNVGNSFAPDYYSMEEYQDYVEQLTGGIGSSWNPGSTDFLSIGSTQYNMKNFIGTMLDESTEQTIFERAKTPFLIACCLEMLAPKTGERFTTGSHTFTFSSRVVGVCGSQAAIGGMVGTTITIQVSNTSNTSNYDQMIYFPDASNDNFTSDQWVYIRNSSDVLNFSHYEKQTASAELQVTSVAFNKIAQSGNFQYASKGPNDIALYRMVLDLNNNDSRVYAYKKNVGTGANTSFNLSSTYSDHTQMALSVSWAGFSSGTYSTAGTDKGACVSTSNGSIVQDNTNSCTSIGKSVLDASGGSSANSSVDNMNISSLVSSATSGDQASKLPTFDTTTILSASLGL